ncbi:T9SS type A sorting domain-containing protein [Mariniflexile gromovii]|uniref:T9SS type A sorting domain-containing protein n=1 Tax=Mariniflexile gromovii TaxID=362523 RepID=A0ABS4BRB1_9FLAO|nr:T9SS type A sorting domain-containing protein [Mariniflexile gromovii]MBP0903099.1 T9SS type A sorting domain-containing protein [Mariniflexile gromovii]
MKNFTLLWLTLSLFFSFQSNAQIFDSENFNALTAGNIGTNTTGTVAGQGNFYTITNTGLNSDFQIVDAGGGDNVLQITGSSNGSGTRYIWKDGLNDFWNNTRTPTNNIIEVEFWFFTGSTTTSKNEISVEIYDTGYTKIIAGLVFFPETKIIEGLLYANGSSGLGTYYVFLGNGGTADVVLLEDTWYKAGIAFDVTTGEVTYRSSDFYLAYNGSAMGNTPFETDIVVYPGTDNTVSTTSYFDDFKVRAVATEMLLLGVDNNEISKSIKLFPNPVNDVINLTMPNTIKPDRFEISDINGRIVKTLIDKNIRNQISVSELSSGVYLLNIYSTEGKTTKKFIKN